MTIDRFSVLQQLGQPHEWPLLSSGFSLRYLTPVVGPTAVVLLHRIADPGLVDPVFSVDDTAADLGVKPERLIHAIDRLHSYRVANVTRAEFTASDGTYLGVELLVRVPLRCAPLASKFGKRMPDTLSNECPHREDRVTS